MISRPPWSGMDVLSFSKSISLWDEQNASVIGKRFQDYLRLASDLTAQFRSWKTFANFRKILKNFRKEPKLSQKLSQTFARWIFSSIVLFLCLTLQCQRTETGFDSAHWGFASKTFGARKSLNKFGFSLADAVFDLLLQRNNFLSFIVFLVFVTNSMQSADCKTCSAVKYGSPIFDKSKKVKK